MEISPCDCLKLEVKVGNIIDDSFSHQFGIVRYLKCSVAMKRSDKLVVPLAPVKNCNTGCMGLEHMKSRNNKYL